jgi:hypothetical protein
MAVKAPPGEGSPPQGPTSTRTGFLLDSVGRLGPCASWGTAGRASERTSEGKHAIDGIGHLEGLELALGIVMSPALGVGRTEEGLLLTTRGPSSASARELRQGLGAPAAPRRPLESGRNSRMWCPICPSSLSPLQGELGQPLGSGLGSQTLGGHAGVYPASDRRGEDVVRVRRSLLEGCRIPTVVLQVRPIRSRMRPIPTAVLQST